MDLAQGIEEFKTLPYSQDLHMELAIVIKRYLGTYSPRADIIHWRYLNLELDITAQSLDAVAISVSELQFPADPSSFLIN